MSFFRSLVHFGHRVFRSVADLAKAAAGELFWDGRENLMVIPGKSRHVVTQCQKDIVGGSGETSVETYLQKKGWCILEKNLVLPSCEFDLIALDSGTLVFIEEYSFHMQYPFICHCLYDGGGKEKFCR